MIVAFLIGQFVRLSMEQLNSGECEGVWQDEVNAVAFTSVKKCLLSILVTILEYTDSTGQTA